MMKVDVRYNMELEDWKHSNPARAQVLSRAHPILPRLICSKYTSGASISRLSPVLLDAKFTI